MRRSKREDHVLYSSHTIWASQEDFTAWTKSEQFRAAHQHAGERKPLTLGHPDSKGSKSSRRSKPPIRPHSDGVCFKTRRVTISRTCRLAERAASRPPWRLAAEHRRGNGTMVRGKVTVFGGTGFLGRHVVQHLLDCEFSIRVVTASGTHRSPFPRRSARHRVDPCRHQ